MFIKYEQISIFKYHSYQFEQFFPIVYDRTRYWLIIKTFCQKTSHFHEKSLFLVTLAPWWQSNTLKILKIFLILLKPISKGNFILLLDGTIPIFIFLHRHSQHPNAHSLIHCHTATQTHTTKSQLVDLWRKLTMTIARALAHWHTNTQTYARARVVYYAIVFPKPTGLIF